MTNSDVTMDSPGNRRAPSSMRAGPADAVARFEVSVHRQLEPIEADWRLLDGLAGNSLHHAYDWCSTWVKTHGSDLVVLHVTLDGELFLILPLELKHGRLFRTARLIGTEHSNLNTALFAENASAVTTPALAATLANEIRKALRGLADVVMLDRMPSIWRGRVGPLATLADAPNPNPSFQLPLLGSIEKTLAQINAKRRRKKMRISERRLAEMGGYDYVVASTVDEARSLLDTFFRQKAARFATLGLPDVFQEPETRAFFHALAAQQDGGAPLMELNAICLRGAHDGRVVAVAGLSKKGDHVICQFGSIDEALAGDASPGELLFYRMIERLSAEGIRLFDFGVGDQPYKRSWCTIETPLSDIVLPVSFAGHLAGLRHHVVVRAKRAVKANKSIYGGIQRARRLRQSRSSDAAPD
ncbi:GNAT family N-acetyltransferase [Ensifer sp.]|jgi:CelD/BcsL family acetyltransferase involved in cellulose biosynthesis|uniref:GNAT family N-acetyltransferase n=1 Tax=Ensifer sp. TaxID=1872086 RepID=UPI0039C8BA09